MLGFTYVIIDVSQTIIVGLEIQPEQLGYVDFYIFVIENVFCQSNIWK